MEKDPRKTSATKMGEAMGATLALSVSVDDETRDNLKRLLAVGEKLDLNKDEMLKAFGEKVLKDIEALT